uniref:RAB19, member RAS oncogene family n=1 Tax=Junco hyemalis TaxID=40217 RepID=A0A8C5I9H3_JUNHY
MPFFQREEQRHSRKPTQCPRSRHKQTVCHRDAGPAAVRGEGQGAAPSTARLRERSGLPGRPGRAPARHRSPAQPRRGRGAGRGSLRALWPRPRRGGERSRAGSARQGRAGQGRAGQGRPRLRRRRRRRRRLTPRGAARPRVLCPAPRSEPGPAFRARRPARPEEVGGRGRPFRAVPRSGGSCSPAAAAAGALPAPCAGRERAAQPLRGPAEPGAGKGRKGRGGGGLQLPPAPRQGGATCPGRAAPAGERLAPAPSSGLRLLLLPRLAAGPSGSRDAVPQLRHGRCLRLPLQDHPDRRLQRGEDVRGAPLQDGAVQREAAEHHRRRLHRALHGHRRQESKGNKSDSLDKRQVLFEDACTLAEKHGLLAVLETSAKEAQNIEEVFTLMAKELIARNTLQLHGENPPNSFSLDSRPVVASPSVEKSQCSC